MSFLDRFTNGWEIAVSSLKVLNANKRLIIFPILSGISLLLVIASFVTILFAGSGWNVDNIQMGRGTAYLILFLYYIINYFVIVFFNMALIHCARLYFEGEEVTISKGLQFSMSRIGAVFQWAVFSATVGFILKMIQENVGWLGKIITGIIGIVWGIATFFAVPVIAYENLSPTEAVKRSSQIMKQKWGEGLGATFSFGMLVFFCIIIFAVLGMAIGNFVNEGAGIALFVLGILMTFIVSSTLHTIFVSAVYHSISGNNNEHYSQDLIDRLFVEKRK